MNTPSDAPGGRKPADRYHPQRNGELKEYIAAGTVREEFLRRVRKSLGIMPPSDPARPAPEQQPQQAPAGHRSAGVDASARDFSSGASSSALDTPASSSRDEQVEEQQQPRRDKGKGRAEPEPSSDSAAPHAEVAKASDDYKRRRLETQEARRRILEQIEHDKAARRERDEQRKLARRAAAAGDDDGQNTAASSRPAETAQPSTGPIGSASAAAASRQSKTCALQVRDFDGSTIRTRLSSGGTLRKEVREWVDASRVAAGQAKDPYLFKVVLTPLPNRTIEETEEDQSLADLGLAPSSTIILVPVRRFATAYGGPGAPSRGLLAGLWAMIFGFLNPIVLFFRAFWTRQEGEEIEMATLNRSRQQQDQSSNPVGRQEQGSARVTGFRNPNDDRRDQQLYNGNSVGICLGVPCS